MLAAIARGELAQVNLLAAQAGEPEPLDAREIADWDAFFAKYPNRVFTGRTDTGEPAEWHYYASGVRAPERADGWLRSCSASERRTAHR